MYLAFFRDSAKVVIQKRLCFAHIATETVLVKQCDCKIIN